MTRDPYNRRSDWGARAFLLAQGPSLKESLLWVSRSAKACGTSTLGRLPSNPDLWTDEPFLLQAEECLNVQNHVRLLRQAFLLR